ncbi:MAG: hypothetical protein CML68_20180 [Rhodobacteraceae bacterium]|nr:hypothetical protein [Paracoccaceae bacterium]
MTDLGRQVAGSRLGLLLSRFGDVLEHGPGDGSLAGKLGLLLPDPVPGAPVSQGRAVGPTIPPVAI